MKQNILDAWFPTPNFAKEARHEEPVWRYVLEILAFALFFIIYLFFLLGRSARLLYSFCGGWTPDMQVFCGLFPTIIGILLALLFCRLVEGRRPRTLGFVKKGMGKDYAIGLAVGLVGFSFCIGLAAAFGVVRLDGFVPQIAWPSILLLFFGFMIQGMSEEVISRGYLMITVAKKAPIWVGVLVSAIFFSCAHFSALRYPLTIINIILIGIFLSLFFLRRGSIWMAAGFHTAWNFTQGNFYGLAVSGHTAGSSVVRGEILPGSQLLTGGEFGLEGSIFVTVFVIIGIIVQLCIKPVDYSAA